MSPDFFAPTNNLTRIIFNPRISRSLPTTFYSWTNSSQDNREYYYLHYHHIFYYRQIR